jgi:hypothetical protein
MNKTYILKKDYPCVQYDGVVVTMAAGTKLQKMGYSYAIPNSDQRLHGNIIENNPEWFEEVKEEFTASVVHGTRNAQLLFSGPLSDDEKLILKNVVAKFAKRVNKRRSQPLRTWAEKFDAIPSQKWKLDELTTGRTSERGK